GPLARVLCRDRPPRRKQLSGQRYERFTGADNDLCLAEINCGEAKHRLRQGCARVWHESCLLSATYTAESAGHDGRSSVFVRHDRGRSLTAIGLRSASAGSLPPGTHKLRAGWMST